MRDDHVLSLSRRAKGVLLTIFLASCGFAIVQQMALSADLVDDPDFGAGVMQATSPSVAWLVATRIIQCVALQTLAALLVIALRRNTIQLKAPLVGLIAVLMQMQAVSQIIQAWGLFHDVWHARDIVNSAEAIVEILIISVLLITTIRERPNNAGHAATGQ